MKSQLSDALSGVLDKIKRNPVLSDNKTGLSTGIEVLDVYLRGISQGEVIVLTGERKHQIALILNVALNIGTNNTTTVHYYSLGQTKESVALNLLCTHANINAHKPYAGTCNAYELESLSASAEVIKNSNIKLNCHDNLSLENFKSMVINTSMDDKNQITIVDFIQLIDFGRDFYTEYSFIATAIQKLKEIAEGSKTPIIVLYYDHEKQNSYQPQLTNDDLINLMHTNMDALIFIHDAMSSGSPDQNPGDPDFLMTFFADKFGTKVDLTIPYFPYSRKIINLSTSSE